VAKNAQTTTQKLHTAVSTLFCGWTYKRKTMRQSWDETAINDAMQAVKRAKWV